jgi:predicted RNase H-like HicB family nuclease
MNKALFIHAEWDDEALVWVATSDDVPGLATESETVEALIAKLEVLIPELLEANDSLTGTDVPFELLTRRFQTTRRRHA